MKKLQIEINNALDVHIMNNDSIVIYTIYKLLKKAKTPKEMDQALSLINMSVAVTESNKEEVISYICFYIEEYNPVRALKEGKNPFTLQKLARLFSFHYKNEYVRYNYSSLNKLISDFGFDKDIVCAVILEQIRYRSHIMTDKVETIFCNTSFAFEATLDDLEKEIKNDPDYGSISDKYEILNKKYLENVKNIPIPF